MNETLTTMRSRSSRNAIEEVRCGSMAADSTGRRTAGLGSRVVVALAVVSLLAVGCTPKSARPPVSKTGEVTFYLSLPGATTGLGEAATRVATPGSSRYRHFSSLDNAARQFGASDAQINAVTKSINSLGLRFVADRTRLFGRVTGSTQQWQAALGSPLAEQAATAPTAAATPTAGAKRWPFNTGTPLLANCSSRLLQQRRVYTPQQVQAAYGIDTLRAHTSGTPVITILDLGGGWLEGDLHLAGQCFGYSPPKISQTQGDGVATAIAHADDETSLDLQTAAAVAPGRSSGWCRPPWTASWTGSAGRWATLAAPQTSSRCPTAGARSPRTGACPPTPW
jgi:hypothetical protein